MFDIIYATVLLNLIIIFLITSLIDTTDPLVKTKNQGLTVISEDNLLYCEFCNLFVDVTCYHCWRCGRCSHGFDHHCKWIANCIAKENYKHFVYLIASLSIYLSLHIACAIKLIVKVSDHSETQIIIVTISLVIATIHLYFTIFLICFHILL